MVGDKSPFHQNPSEAKRPPREIGVIASYRQPPPQPGSNGRNKLVNEKGNPSLGHAEAPASISFRVLVISILKQMTLKTMQSASQHLFSGVPSQ